VRFDGTEQHLHNSHIDQENGGHIVKDTDRGKRRARGQRIGGEGEAFFKLWAIRQGLTANKVEEDLGIDFFCQVLEPTGTKGSEESLGRVFGAQVKSVENDPSPSIILERIDAVDLLRQRQATCVFGVDLAHEEVRFRFIDKREIDRLLGFLDSDAESISLPYAMMMRDSSTFRNELLRLTEPSKQHQLRIYQIQKRLDAAIPGADISITQSSTDSMCLITVPWIDTIFDIDSSVIEEVRIRMFHEGEIPLHLPGITLKPQLMKPIVDGAHVVTGARQRSTKLVIDWKNEHAVTTFMVRHFGDEFAFVHRAGLRISMSGARKIENQWIHEMESDLFAPSTRVSLRGSAFSFLRLLRPGAQITMPSGSRVPIEQWGQSLAAVGPAVEAGHALSQALKIPFGDFQLFDLRDEEFGHTLGFLDSFLLESTTLDQLMPGFVIGPLVDVPPEEIPKQEASMTLPIVLNWKDIGIVIWVTGQGYAFVQGDLCCGFQMDKQESWHIQKLGRFTKSPYPEVWVDKNWPAIRLHNVEPGVQIWDKNANSTITLEAHIRSK